MNLDHDIDDIDTRGSFDAYDPPDPDPGFDAYDAGFLDFDGGYEDYEPNPYDGTYSEE